MPSSRLPRKATTVYKQQFIIGGTILPCGVTPQQYLRQILPQIWTSHEGHQREIEIPEDVQSVVIEALFKYYDVNPFGPLRDGWQIGIQNTRAILVPRKKPNDQILEPALQHKITGEIRYISKKPVLGNYGKK